MVVIGIDFGNESCVVTSVRNNRVEAVANDYYDRKTPSLVAFTDKKREIGMAARNQQSTNLINTIYDFKKFLGTHFYKTPRFVFNEIILGDFFYYRLNYMNEEKFHLPLEVTEMLLSKLKRDANAALEPTPITGCVIAYPSYFSPLGKKQLLLAAGVAGLNCHYIIKETTAVAIDYCFYKKFQRRKNVVFIDFGANSIQISACAFFEKKLEVLCEVSGLIGGRDIDELLTEHIIKKLDSPEMNADNKKFCFKLINEVEKAKKKMSIDTVRMPLNLTPFISDECYSLSLDREEMDEVCRDLYNNIEYLMEQCLVDSKLDVYDIDSVEIVGGSTRIPAVKDLIRKVFKKTPSTTMNQDEAVARGCLLRFIMATKRRDFEIVEKELPGVENDRADYIRIVQLHSNYRGDKNDFLYINQHFLDIFMKFEEKLLMNDKNEEERCVARNKYEELGKTLRKPGMLDPLGEIERTRVLKFLSNSNDWQNGTTEQYLEMCTKLKKFVEEEKKKVEMQKKITKSSFVIVHSKVEQKKDQSTMTYKADSNRYGTRSQKKEQESPKKYQSYADTVKESKFSDFSGCNMEVTSKSNNTDSPSTSSKYDYGCNKKMASSLASDERGNFEESKNEGAPKEANLIIFADENNKESPSHDTNKEITSDIPTSDSNNEVNSDNNTSKSSKDENDQNKSIESMDVDQEQSSSKTLHLGEKEKKCNSIGWDGYPLPKNCYLTVKPREGKVNKTIYRFFEDWYSQSKAYLTFLRDNSLDVDLRVTIFMTRKSVLDTAKLLMKHVIPEEEADELQDKLDSSMKDLSYEAALRNFEYLERYLSDINRKYKNRK